MQDFFAILAAVVPIFLVIACGAGVRRLNWLTEEADQSLVRLTVNLLIPALILDALLGNQALGDLRNILIAPAIGFATVIIGYALSYFLAPLFGVAEIVRRRTFAFIIGMYNYGYIPIPLVIMMFDRETLGVLFLHNLGVEVAFWTVGLILLQGGMKNLGWKRILNPPVAAIIVGIIFHFVGADAVIPEFIQTTIQLLGSIAIPLALILIGATMADHLDEFDPKRGLAGVAGACFLRLGLLAVIFLGIAVLLPSTQELKRVVVLQSAMPSAVFPLLIAKHYHGHVPTALRIIVWTSLLSLLTIPLWIHLGLRLIGE